MSFAMELWDGRSLPFVRVDAIGALSAPGLYAFVSTGWPGQGCRILYIGRTGEMSERLSRHEKWAEALRLDAKAACFVHYYFGSHDQLVHDEKLLILTRRPPMNEQHKPPLSTNQLLGRALARSNGLLGLAGVSAQTEALGRGLLNLDQTNKLSGLLDR